MKIPNELIPLAYTLSKQVFENKISFSEGRKELVGENRMNTNSAADYINNYRHLIRGELFKRTLNAYSMNHFLKKIHEDYGMDGLNNALKALGKHIEYYEGLQKITMHKMRKIHNEFSMHTNDSLDEIEQNEIIRILNKKTKEDIISELKELNPSDPEIVNINSQAYKRNNKTIAQIKILRDFKCQICSTRIKKKDGGFYIEAAHIKPKRLKGNETPDNIILLCPNHHKEFDYGDRQILNHDNNEIQFILNGKKYSISLKLD